MSAVDDRHRRQVRFARFGAEGQARLAAASVAVVGCGATGGAAAELLARAGAGRLILIDRDIVALDNLHRQVLFEESDARQGRPKAIAGAEYLRRLSSGTRIEPAATHLDTDNIDRLLRGTDLVVDGTDNVSTRFLLNDWCFERVVPWIYVGAVGGAGMLLPIVPPEGPCLRCLLPEPPPPGTLATCDTAGVLGPVPPAMGAMAALEAMKILAGPLSPGARKLRTIDFWDWRVRTIELPARPDCPCCRRGEREFLHAARGTKVVELCGRDTHQVLPPGGTALDLAELARRVEGEGEQRLAPRLFLRLELDAERMTIFPDGRALVEGAGNGDRARALYDRYVGT